jgi:hypothetical protein
LAKKSELKIMILSVMLFGDSGPLTRKGTLIPKWRSNSWYLRTRSRADMKKEIFLRASHSQGLEPVSISSLTTNTTLSSSKIYKNRKFTAKSVINNGNRLSNYKLSKIKEIKARL